MNMLKSKSRYCLFLSLVVLSSSVESPRADVITHTFTGTITFVSGELFGLSPSIGQRVQGSFAYDSSPPPAFDTGAVAGYIQSPPSGMSVAFAGVTLQSQNYNSFQVIQTTRSAPLTM